MFDTEKFIYEIKKRPSIWDSRHESYRNKIIKGNDWSEVGREMFPEWFQWNTEQKKNKGQELVTKWKSIKDKFRRCIKEEKSLKSGAAAKKKKTYVYYQCLQFLRPVMEEHDLSSNITPSTTTADESSTSTQNTDLSNDFTPKRQYQQKSNPVVKALDIAKRQDNDSELLNILKERNKKEMEMMNDEDTLFALSLVTSLKKMSTSVKLRTKIEILSVIENNIMYNNEQDNSTLQTNGDSTRNIQSPNRCIQEYNINNISTTDTRIPKPVEPMPQFEDSQLPSLVKQAKIQSLVQMNDWAQQLMNSPSQLQSLDHTYSSSSKRPTTVTETASVASDISNALSQSDLDFEFD